MFRLFKAVFVSARHVIRANKQEKQIESLKGTEVTLFNGNKVIIESPDYVAVNRFYGKNPENGEVFLVELDNIEEDIIKEVCMEDLDLD